MNHASTTYFKPTRLLAKATARSSTRRAPHIYFQSRLNKGKITGTKPRYNLLPQHFAPKFFHSRKKIGKAHPSIDVKSLNLMKKNVGARRNRLIAKTFTRSNH